MSRVFAIAVALSAVLFVTFAYPQEAEPEPAEETTTTASPGAGGNTTLTPCEMYEQCLAQNNQTGQVTGAAANFPGGIGGAMPKPPNPCMALEQACKNSGGVPTPPEVKPPGGLPTTIEGMPNVNGTTMPNVNGTTLPNFNGTGMPPPPVLPAFPPVPAGRK